MTMPQQVIIFGAWAYLLCLTTVCACVGCCAAIAYNEFKVEGWKSPTLYSMALGAVGCAALLWLNLPLASEIVEVLIFN